MLCTQFNYVINIQRQMYFFLLFYNAQFYTLSVIFYYHFNYNFYTQTQREGGGIALGCSLNEGPGPGQVYQVLFLT